VMQRKEQTKSCSNISADIFHTFFDDKLDIAQPSAAKSPPSTHETLRCYTKEEVCGIIFESPIKSCALHPIPTTQLWEMIDVLLLVVTNALLREGCLPISQDVILAHSQYHIITSRFQTSHSC